MSVGGLPQTLAEFLAHAIAIETEAELRYRELADQLSVHHNAEVARVFERMARAEALHIDQLRQRAEGLDLPALAPWEYQWDDSEAPEVTAHEAVHYKMTARHALLLALDNERKAFTFFARIRDGASDPEVQAMAAEFAAEEEHHIGYVEELLAQHPEPARNWADDPDPPNEAE